MFSSSRIGRKSQKTEKNLKNFPKKNFRRQKIESCKSSETRFPEVSRRSERSSRGERTFEVRRANRKLSFVGGCSIAIWQRYFCRRQLKYEGGELQPGPGKNFVLTKYNLFFGWLYDGIGFVFFIFYFSGGMPPPEK